MPTLFHTSATRPHLSLCMIVKNERETLARCLTSVKDVVDEIVIVDTGSTDGTQEIARQHGANLIQTAWENDFSRARNQSLAAATGAWILVLDADEYLLPEDGAALRELTARHTTADGAATAAFQLVMQNVDEDGRPGMLVGIVRLFPNRDDVRFEWPIHEQVMTSLQRALITVHASELKFIHTGYARREKNIQKQVRNRDILQAQIESGREVTPMTHFLLAGCHLDMRHPEAALETYRRAYREAAIFSKADPVARGAQVRIATCLVALGRFAEAIAEMPAAIDAGWHPELIALRAEAAARLGNSEDARAWYEAVLGCSDTPQIPPYDLVQLKCDALLFLGTFWRTRGKPGLGVALLRAAVALKQQGKKFGESELMTLYRATRHT